MCTRGGAMGRGINIILTMHKKQGELSPKPLVTHQGTRRGWVVPPDGHCVCLALLAQLLALLVQLVGVQAHALLFWHLMPSLAHLKRQMARLNAVMFRPLTACACHPCAAAWAPWACQPTNMARRPCCWGCTCPSRGCPCQASRSCRASWAQAWASRAQRTGGGWRPWRQERALQLLFCEAVGKCHREAAGVRVYCPQEC